MSVYDTGGLLNRDANGGFALGGLEVDPLGGTVYVAAANTVVGGTSTSVQLISSAGLGMAVIDPSGPQPLRYSTRGNDLTHLGGVYYVAATDSNTNVAGVYGITPGTAGLTTFAAGAGIRSWATSGLTFDVAGTTALVTSDVGIGHHSIAAGAITTTLLSNFGVLPNGYGANSDDHVVTLDGRVIVAGDSGRGLYDVTGGPGSISLLIDVDSVVGPFPGFGSRVAVDPTGGDIFFAMGAGGGRDIFRVKADGSGAIPFAAGFVGGVRDIDFGLASDGSGEFSLYATEVNGSIGSIYEFTVPIPEPSTFTLALLATLGLSFYRRRRRRVA